MARSHRDFDLDFPPGLDRHDQSNPSTRLVGCFSGRNHLLLSIAADLETARAQLTRQSVAIAQMFTSALFIHLTGGRIETHFHVFGSLAFLAFYRDWRVLLTGSVVVAADLLLRGVFWPDSVFGAHAPGFGTSA